MFTSLSRKIFLQSYRESSRIFSRNYSSVTLAFSKYQKNENSDQKNLIVLHGLFGSKANWNSLCKVYVQKTNPMRHVFAIDARNHGESLHTDEHNYDLMAEDIKKFIEDQKLNKTALLGHSMGGRGVIYFALKYPHLVEKLIVVDISPVGRIGTTQSDIPLFIKAMQSIQIPDKYTIHQGRTVADEKLSSIIGEKSLRDFLITNLMKTQAGEFKWRINLETLSRCFQEGVAQFPNFENMRFDGPTLFIGGSKSDYLKPSDKPIIQKIFPNMTMEFLDAGHWVHAEKSEEFLKLTIDFLNK